MPIDGKKIASEILARLEMLPKPKKFLAAVLVGGDPASVSFIKQKEAAAKELGVDFRLYRFPATATGDELRAEVGRIAAHATCGGVVVQLPLPDGVNAQYILNAVPRERDVDVLGERALGAFYAGRNPVAPPSVGTLEVVLAATRSTLGDMRVAVVGLGTLVGKPIATWLMGKAKGVWLLGRASDASVLKDADVVVLGAGRPGIVTPTMLKEGALVVDFGYSKAPQAPSRMDADQSAPACRQAGMNAESTKSHIFGDFDPAGSEEKNISYTPTPGGTGPILVAKLFENFYVLNADKRG